MSGAPSWPRPASEAVAWSRARSAFLPAGQCARHVASAYTRGLTLGQFGVASAIDAWHQATQKVTDGSTPPAGAPVYWSIGKWGHIALSVGGGRVRSTDYPRDTQLGECTLAEMGRRWPGMTYLGWSRDMAGHPIPGLERTAQASPTKEDDMPLTDDDAKRVWRADIIPSPDEKDAWQADTYLRGTYNLAKGADAKAARAEAAANAGLAQLGALRQLVAQLVAAQGQELTAEQITAAAKAGADQALSERIQDATVTLEVTP